MIWKVPNLQKCEKTKFEPRLEPLLVQNCYNFSFFSHFRCFSTFPQTLTSLPNLDLIDFPFLKWLKNEKLSKHVFLRVPGGGGPF